MFKLSIFLVFLSLCVACTKDEAETTGGISGLVTNRENGEPLSGVNITLNPSGKAATTGSDGRYEFSGLEPAIYTIQAKCSGYKTNTKSITVVAGEIMVGDLQMEVGADNFSLSTRELKFSPSNTSNVFSVTNTSVSMPISWSITECPAWLSVSQRSNDNLQKGKSDDIVVTLGNNPQSEGYIVIQSAGSTVSIYVTYSTNEGGGEGEGEGGNEDYSSATISQCDSRLKAQIVSCLRSGSTVVFTCNLTNTGLGTVNDFRIYPPSSSSLINDGVRSVITDDRGNEYPAAKISFRNGSASSSNIANGTLPENVACKCTVTLSSVPESVKKLTLVKIGVYTYPDSQYHLANKYIDFKNVPIY